MDQAIEALLERHLADDVVDPDGLFLFHHAVELHGPGADRQLLRRRDHVLVEAELVEIVVAGCDLLGGNVAVEHVFRVALNRIEICGGVGHVGRSLREGARRERTRGGDRGGAADEGAAIEENMLGGRLRFGDFPAAAADDVHVFLQGATFSGTPARGSGASQLPVREAGTPPYASAGANVTRPGSVTF
jgi:hypothetical protein